MNFTRRRVLTSSFFTLAASSAFSLCVTGCGVQSTLDLPLAGPSIRGIVHGGQQPIHGAVIQLFAAGTTGYGTGALSLLKNPVTTAVDGSFTITGDYTCPSATSLLYLTSTGGDASGGNGNNAHSVMLAALGPCFLINGVFTLNPNLYVVLNEVTTAASVYPLAAFIDPVTTQIGAPASNLTGITNAFNTVPTILSLSTGSALATTPSGNGIVNQEELNSLANSLAPCIDSDGTGSSCAALILATTPANGTAPGNTLQAMISIATHPTSQVATIWKLPLQNAPFYPPLGAAPNDWSLAITYTITSGVNQSDIAIDGTGNAWISLLDASQFSGPGNLTELSAGTGAVLSGSSGFTGGGLSIADSVAIDPSGFVWASNLDNGVLSKFTSTGSPVSGSGFTSGVAAGGLAIDGFGNIWAPSNLTTISKYDTNGSLLLSVPQSNAFRGISIDGSENIWLAQVSFARTGGAVTKVSNAGSVIFTHSYTSGGLQGPYAVANDHAGNAWVTNLAVAPSLNEISAAGGLLSPAGGYTDGGIASPTSIAIDGAGNTWIGSSNTLVERSNTGVLLSGPTSGFVLPGSPAAVGAIAVDASGNVWAIAGSNSTYELLGAAVPVATPLSVAVKNNTVGSRP